VSDQSPKPAGAGLAAALARSRMLNPLAWFDTSAQIELRRFAGPACYGELMHTPLRVAHVTDIHVGRITAMKVQQAAVELVNSQRPDLVCITGDFVCHSQMFLDQLGELIGAYEAPVVAVLGNHDHWSGGPEVRATLRRAGAEVLDNVHTTITLRGQALQLVGLDDAYTGHADVEKAVRGLRHDLPTLGLSHIAEESDRLWAAGVPLVLSGHTHAGQVTLARLNELALGRLIGHKYVHGLYGTRASPAPCGAVYVGAGIGAAVIGLRMGERARREVTIFELGALPGSFEEHHDDQPALPGRAPTERTKLKRIRQVELKREKRERKAAREAARTRRNGDDDDDGTELV
jgi:predicted MPP superfamily phosphohydrolase